VNRESGIETRRPESRVPVPPTPVIPCAAPCGSGALQTRDPMREVPDLRRVIARRSASGMTGVERNDHSRHPVRSAARSGALQTRDLSREVPDLPRVIACRGASGMTGAFDNHSRHPVRSAARERALQTRDLSREVPDLRCVIARRSASGMTGVERNDHSRHPVRSAVRERCAADTGPQARGPGPAQQHCVLQRVRDDGRL
jgi:hypothetical protein